MKRQKPRHDPKRRPAWVRPKLTRIGDFEKIVRAGGGKLSAIGDPGDGRKASGLG
jgi:hypothetical protein